MITRRSFVKSSFALAGAAALPSGLFAAAKKPAILGIQLYSVRADMKTDPRGTLQQLAAMGYKYVEHANYIDRRFYGFPAAEFKKILDDLGLAMRSGHTVMNGNHWDGSKKDFTDAWKYTIADAATMDQLYVISPSMDAAWYSSYDNLRRALELFNKSGELCKKNGVKFGYHNHAFEFSTLLGGRKLYDIILAETDPSLVVQQLDIGNMYNAGAQAAEYIRRYPGRFELMHVKDEIKATETGAHEPYESTVLGNGVIGTRDVAALGRQTGGTTDFIVEQESYQGKTPVDCAKEDFNRMKKWGY
ncbi:MAG: sugar phosphate isomerase/epimerase [Bacteroidetes bacterium]|nr:sugar phosphate isomerase/epimerase [Bacteroidota bacterium]